MKYQIDLHGIHCHGCINLVRMTLEDLGLKDVNLFDLDLVKQFGHAEFNSNYDEKTLNDKLNSAFTELKDHGYSYSNLISITH